MEKVRRVIVKMIVVGFIKIFCPESKKSQGV